MLRRVPAFFALALLGAHAVRSGAPTALAVVATLVAMTLLFAPGRAATVAVSAALWGGAAAWARVAFVRASERVAEGRPWLRLALILGAVTLFTAWAAALLRCPREPSPPAGA